MNATGSPSRKPPYNRRLVDFVLAMERAMVRWGISDFVYFVVAGPLAAMVYAWFFLKHGVEIRGKENVPPKGTGFFLLCNHISKAEAPVIASWLYPRPFWFPSKAEFYKSWVLAFFWQLCTAVHTFPVRRGERDLKAVGLMQELLAKGKNVLLFPEGTRGDDRELLPGKRGVGMIVHQAQALVLPVYVRGFAAQWPSGRLLPLFKAPSALISFGPPMDLSKYWEQDLSRAVAQGIVDDVMAEIARLKAEVEADDALRTNNDAQASSTAEEG
jgi:1-acyl-sn-glycerol-3-phosphate acyltransferase